MLLALLRRKLKLNLPADGRTLLKTPTKVGFEIQSALGGQYWYRGIENALQTYFQDVVPQVNTFSMQVFLDGLPLFKSSARQLWPILIKVEELPEAAMMLVGLFCGHSKPDNVEGYLRPLVLEINDLQRRGLQFGDKTVQLKLRMIVADSPARCFAKVVDAELRTDAEFRSRADKEHHKSWRSLLEELEGFDMVVANIGDGDGGNGSSSNRDLRKEHHGWLGCDSSHFNQYSSETRTQQEHRE
uniref:Uncharacterized protein n=1 Tax=Anopheles epiroticus TaxID=199890 RepID=A0A182PWP6_9DIPT